MKKSVLVMAGLLAMALAGSAQAAPMFAVQDATGTIDKFTVDAAGMVNAEGQALNAGGAFGSQLSKAPGSAPLTGPAGVFHVASDGNNSAAPAFLAQHTAFPSAVGGSSFFTGTAPNFSFFRINKNDANHPTAPNAYVLPQTGNALGYLNFGSLDVTQDPNVGGRKNIAGFYVRAESTWSSLTDTPTYFWWAGTTTGGGYVEKMRLSSAGNLGIGVTTTPTSKLQVVGLLVSADETGLPVPAGLTPGAFYRTPAGVVRVAP